MKNRIYKRKSPIKIGVLSHIIKLLILIVLFLAPFAGFGQRFTILHTSDEHSNLLPLPLVDYRPQLPNPSLGGFARLSTFVQSVENQKGDEPVLLFSSGDFIGGSPFAWLILEGYSPELDIMKRIGYDAVNVGNHEFDYGPDALTQYLKRLGYPAAHDVMPIIASNLNIPDDHSLHQAGLQQYRIISLPNGLRAGVIGILGNKAYSVAPSAKPVEIHPPVENAREKVALLTQAGVDFIILLSHSGIEEDRILANEVEGIDIILGGHDHIITPEPEIVNNTIILHSSYYLQKVGKLELEFERETGSVKLLNTANNTPYLITLDSSIEEDPAIAQMIYNYGTKLNVLISEFTENKVSNFDQVVMVSDFSLVKEADLQETTIGNFLTDAMRIIGSEVTGTHVDIAFQANGVIRGDIIPGVMEWSEDKVSFLDLATISGLGTGPDMRPGYPMVSFYLTEREVFKVLEIAALLSQIMGDTYFLQFSGLRFTYDPNKALWLRIPFLGTPVPAYRSVINAQLFTGQGIQGEDTYIDINPEGERLLHIVSDHYLTSFLPMIGEILPKLKLVLKDKNGNPLTIEETIINYKGREFKVWEALVRYSVSLEKNELGISVMPAAYQTTQGRIVAQAGTPLYIWSYSILALVILGLALFVRWIIKAIRGRKNHVQVGN